MRLDDLCEIGQAAKFHSRGRNPHAKDGVTGFGRRQQVTDRTDTADACTEGGHLPHQPSLAEGFEPSKLGDMKTCIDNLIVVIDVDADLGMTLDARHRVDKNATCHPVYPNFAAGAPAARTDWPARRSRSACQMRSASGGHPGMYSST